MTGGPQWDLKYDKGARAETNGWSVLVTHLTGGKKPH